MKKIGMIGGLGPESTIDYYKIITNKFHDRTGYNPNIIINSIDIYEMLGYVNEKNYEQLVKMLLDAITTLQKAGADFVFISSNTPHIVYDQLKKQSTIKIISIVESTCKKIEQLNLHKTLLTGTKFTMKENFYKAAANTYKINLIVPNDDEINMIHSVIFPELEEGIVVPEKKSNFINIVNDIKARENIDSIILGCTELPIMINQNDLPIKVVNTVDCHIEEIMKEIFS